MNKKICDKCGQDIIEANSRTKLVLNILGSDIANEPYETEKYDLCKPCTESLRLFLKDKNDNETFERLAVPMRKAIK